MSTPEIQSQILQFIILALPLIAAIWKVFEALSSLEKRLDNAIEAVDARVSALEHKSELRAVQIDSMNDKILLATNGTKELVNHLRTRTKAESDSQQNRIEQIERFLVKTTEFLSRQ